MLNIKAAPDKPPGVLWVSRQQFAMLDAHPRVAMQIRALGNRVWKSRIPAQFGVMAMRAMGFPRGVATQAGPCSGPKYRVAASSYSGLTSSSSSAPAYWDTAHKRASGRAGDGSVDTGLLVRAGLAAIPYLLRQQQWDRAAYLLEHAFIRDPSRANAAAVLPSIEQITRHEPLI